MDCLWCDEEIMEQMTWSDFLLLPSKRSLCANCAAGLEFISGSRCSICSRSSEETLCLDCQKWKKAEGEDVLTKNHSIFTYNTTIQEMITKWKYRGDYCLGEIFKDTVVQSFETAFGYVERDLIVVPIPLSQERLTERGFNQAKMLTDFLPVETKEILTRIHSEKQSKKTRKERITTRNPFSLQETVKKNVILVDDIYTTGATLRHAARLLREAGCPQVYSFTLIRG
ncbi:ComF family protein [Virgibacillus necropolis]|uniref:Competence protein n=1 Tax=Virgibacillus necropolis TaxID=163877 RepID=A0A221MAQ5_9BACI|nr:ComF family protein [Virgibacillus necropolis]ASN04721.1 competence protein [Virgibacillus necropolis]